MKITEETKKYLSGELFSVERKIDFTFDDIDSTYITRHSYLKKLCTGKRIIHIGCVDHNIETINEGIANDSWLHGVVSSVSKRCLGIDINKEGIDYIRDELGYNDLECLDIYTDTSTIIPEQQWDYVIIPEVLEHINDPSAFLEAVKTLVGDNASRLIITVPNAYENGNHSRAKRNYELINTDHRYWFTPFTIMKICALAGLEIDSIRMLGTRKLTSEALLSNPKEFIKDYIHRKRTIFLRGAILVESKLGS